MFEKSALFKRKKTPSPSKSPIPFSKFHSKWHDTLSSTLLPDLSRHITSFSSSPSLLSAHYDAVHQHFAAYYAALDQAAQEDVSQCLYPSWRNSLEIPFMWMGDFHPHLFTNLVRSFLDEQETAEDDEDERGGRRQHHSHRFEHVSFTIQGSFLIIVRSLFSSMKLTFPYFSFPLRLQKLDLETPWHVAVAWQSPSRALTTRIDQIECGLRLMVPALSARAKGAQISLARSFGTSPDIADAVAAEMEEIAAVVVDANRLRRSVLADVLSVTSVYQGALFLEALSKFVVGFRDDKFMRDFNKCQMAVNVHD